MQHMGKIFIVTLLLGFTLNARSSAEELVSLSDEYFDFYEVEVGDEESETLTIENISSSSIRITEIDLWGEFIDFDYYSNCSGILDAGDSCDIELLFAPNNLGDLEASLEIEINGKETFEVYLEGIGIPEE